MSVVSLARAAGVTWLPSNSRSLIVKYDAEAKGTLARVTLDGRISKLTDELAGGGLDRPYSGGEFSVARNGNIAFTTGSVVMADGGMHI